MPFAPSVVKQKSYVFRLKVTSIPEVAGVRQLALERNKSRLSSEIWLSTYEASSREEWLS